ncbi:MAG: LysR substrate-binding domain-containing protein [Paracoccaceae bacterium]
MTICKIANTYHIISSAYILEVLEIMRHSQLRAFHHVALYGGFSRASEVMLISQPAISEQVKNLEQDHDVLLFHRDRKQVRLSREGEELFLLTKRYFEVEDQIEDYMSESHAAVDGTLRIIVDSAQYITDVLSKFRVVHPKIYVTLRTGNSEDVLNTLRTYDAEIGVVGSPTPGSDMETFDLGSSPIVAFASKRAFAGQKSELTLRELVAMPLVLREKGSKTRQKVETAAAAQGLVLRPVVEAEGREAVREIVATGAGIGFVSQAELGHDHRIVQINIANSEIHMNQTLIFLGQRRDVRVIRAFMDFARSHFHPEAEQSQ